MEKIDISFDDDEVENEFKKTSPTIINQTIEIKKLPISNTDKVDARSIFKELKERHIVFYLFIPMLGIPLYTNLELLKYDSALTIIGIGSVISFCLMCTASFIVEKTFYKEVFLKIGSKEIGYKQTKIKKLYNKIKDYIKKNILTIFLFITNTTTFSFLAKDLILIIR